VQNPSPGYCPAAYPVAISWNFATQAFRWRRLIWFDKSWFSELSSGTLTSHRSFPRSFVLTLIHDAYSHATLSLVHRVLRWTLRD
jgi:hypothetical protein